MLIFFPLCLRSRDPAEKTMASASARRPTHSSSRTACGVTAANESTLPLDDATSEELLQLTVVQVAPHRMGKGLFAKLNVERNCVVAKMVNPTILTAKRFDAQIVAKHGNSRRGYNGIDLKDNYFAFTDHDKNGQPMKMILFDHWGDKQAARPRWT